MEYLLSVALPDLETDECEKLIKQSFNTEILVRRPLKAADR